ncbi:hypothetical protein [Streptomyces sp. NPDC059466]
MLAPVPLTSCCGEPTDKEKVYTEGVRGRCLLADPDVTLLTD